MKKLKNVVVLMLIAALCLSFITVAGAKPGKNKAEEEETATAVLSTDVQTLKVLGILTGDENGLTPKYTHSETARIQGFILYLRLINRADEAAKFVFKPGGDNFSDHQGQSDYVKNMMAYAKAHPELNWVGSNGRFNPMAHLTAKEYAKIMLAALGYTDIAWKDVESDAKAMGLTIPTGAFTIETLASMTVRALYLPMKDTGLNLIDYLASVNPGFAAKVALLGSSGGSTSVLTAAGAAAVEVSKLQVTFSNPMKAVDPTEFRVYRSDGVTPVSSGYAYTMDATCKIVTVSLSGSLTASAKAAESDQTTAKLAIGTVNTKDIYGNAVSGAVAIPAVTASAPATVTILDKIAPSVAALAKGTAPYSVVLTFAEPVKAADTAAVAAALKITNSVGAVQLATYAFGGTGTTAASFTTLTATIVGGLDGIYDVELLPQGITDQAGNTVKAFAKTPVTLTAIG
jgi:hypothetical protein